VTRSARPSWKRWGLVLLTVIVAPAHTQELTPVQREWFHGNAIVFDCVRAGNGFNDLEPLKRLIGDARIVALGEPTHGSREVFQMKHRLVEFLVNELGFSIFSIEANMPESFRLNSYVLDGKGDPRALIRGMYFWTWSTEEVREMVVWMRRHNARVEKQKRGTRVRFTGFDVQFPDVAAEIVTRFVEEADEAYAPVVRKAARAAERSRERPPFGVATGTFPVELARGKELLYRGWIRTRDVQDGYAGLWWRCDVGRESRAFDNMQERAPRGTTGWQRFEIRMTVPVETTNINFGVLMPGRGKAWFDGLEITLDGEPVSDPAFDLDFEGARLRGFATPAASYKVTLDPAVSKTGRQSLRIEGAPAAKAGGADAAKTAEAWQSVVSHLEQSQERYLKEQDASWVEWAIVNARLVKDSMDVRSGTDGSVRDRAMARMVGWILEQSPNQRIVLWAHNGHVQRRAGSMGRFLEELFPGQMVVFGFATGKGAYRAVSAAGRGLRDHDLAPPPADSYEHAFQAVGLPRFILDVRKAVPGSPASGWLLEPRRLRSIGSMEMSEQFHPLTIRDSFDAVVWIETTSAAVPLAR
jgi:erythromycin esterase-like protein